MINAPFCASFFKAKGFIDVGIFISQRPNFKARFFLRTWKYEKEQPFDVWRNSTISNLGWNAYLTLFTLIGAHSVVCIDGNKLKNETKCTPCFEKWQKMYAIHWKMIKNRHQVGQKGTNHMCHTQYFAMQYWSYQDVNTYDCCQSI